MKANELRQKFIDFFVSKGHTQISGASVIPENDPTVLFTTAGMHPLVPYILGQPHPAGKRLTDYQKCIRTGDIDEECQIARRQLLDRNFLHTQAMAKAEVSKVGHQLTLSPSANKNLLNLFA